MRKKGNYKKHVSSRRRCIKREIMANGHILQKSKIFSEIERRQRPTKNQLIGSVVKVGVDNPSYQRADNTFAKVNAVLEKKHRKESA